MTEMKNLSVYLGENSVTLKGDNLKTDVVDNRLKVKDGDDAIAEFQNWDYWKKLKDE